MDKKIMLTGAKAIKEEISLTLMLISFVLLSGAGILEVFGKVQTVGPFRELFGSCAALYFARKYNKDKNSKEKTEEK